MRSFGRYQKRVLRYQPLPLRPANKQMDIDLTNKRSINRRFPPLSAIESVKFSESDAYREEINRGVKPLFANRPSNKRSTHSSSINFPVIGLFARYHERFVRFHAWESPGEGIEGITFIHDFRDESIRCVRRPVKFYARAHKADTHTRAAAHREGMRCTEGLLLICRCRSDLSTVLWHAAAVFNIEILRQRRHFETCCKTEFHFARRIEWLIVGHESIVKNSIWMIEYELFRDVEEKGGRTEKRDKI